jgi:hypothetical protein
MLLTSKNKALGTSIALVLAMFTLVLALAHPIYHSDDDVFVMLQNSGAISHSSWSHYSFCWNSLLNIVTTLFYEIFPKQNIYTYILLSANFFAIVLIIKKICDNGGVSLSQLGIITLLACCFLPYFLLHVNFTNTSILLSAAAIAYWFFAFKGNISTRLADNKLPITLLLLASLFRVHSTELVLIVGILAVSCCYDFKALAQLILPIIILHVAINALEYGSYLIKCNTINNFESISKFNEALFAFFNRPIDVSVLSGMQSDKAYVSFISNFVLNDELIVNTANVNALARKASTLNQSALYEMMLYTKYLLLGAKLPLIATAVLLFVAEQDKRKAAIIMACSSITLYILLFYFYKTTQGILYAVMLANFLFATVHCDKQKISQPWFLVISLLLSVAGVVSAFRVDAGNKAKQIQTLKQLNYFKQHPKTLFVASNNDIALAGYSIFWTSDMWPKDNLLTGYHRVTNSTKTIYNKRHIDDFYKELPSRTDILWFGKSLPDFVAYYKMKNYVDVKIDTITDAASGYSFYQIVKE